MSEVAATVGSLLFIVGCCGVVIGNIDAGYVGVTGAMGFFVAALNLKNEGK